MPWPTGCGSDGRASTLSFEHHSGWTGAQGIPENVFVGEDATPHEVSRILRAGGEQPVDMDALLPLVYDKLREIAGRRMASERPGHTLQATALVHEAYLKLVGQDHLAWSSRGHFYAAAVEAMRRILVDHARGKGRVKRGGGRVRLPLDVIDLATREDMDDILSVDAAVRRLEDQDGRLGEIVKLRFYAGLSVRETAKALGLTDRTVYRDWVLARTWLQRKLGRK